MGEGQALRPKENDAIGMLWVKEVSIVSIGSTLWVKEVSTSIKVELVSPIRKYIPSSKPLTAFTTSHGM